jgi:hypothetical protein
MYGVLKRTDGRCESVNQAFDSIPEYPMMSRDGCRPIQRVKELAFMGSNEGNPLVPFGMGFFYTQSESIRGKVQLRRPPSLRFPSRHQASILPCDALISNNLV